MKLGKLIKQARVNKGMSQKDLSNIMGYGTHQFISNLENNRASIPPKQVSKYSKVLGIPFNDLLAGYLKYCKSKVR